MSESLHEGLLWTIGAGQFEVDSESPTGFSLSFSFNSPSLLSPSFRLTTDTADPKEHVGE